MTAPSTPMATPRTIMRVTVSVNKAMDDYVIFDTPGFIRPLHVMMAREHVAIGATEPRMELWYEAEGDVKSLVKGEEYGYRRRMYKTQLGVMIHRVGKSFTDDQAQHLASVPMGRDLAHVYTRLFVEPRNTIENGPVPPYPTENKGE